MNIAVVICGTDNRSNLWPILEYSINKYWPNCSWPKYLITNFKEGPKSFRTIKTGKESTWSNKVFLALARVRADIIFWMMDDFWLTGPADNKTLTEFYKIMKECREIDHISLLCPCYDRSGEIVPKKELSAPVPQLHNKLWHLKSDSNYRASVCHSFWRRKVFRNYLRVKGNDNPWTFENNISPLSTISGGLYLGVIDPNIFPLPNYSNPHLKYKDDVVIKGRWSPAAYEYIKRENLKIDFSFHPNGQINKEYITEEKNGK